MPIKPENRNYAHETRLEKERPGAHEARMERQRARRELDKKGVNRKGKHVAHKKALANGGTNADGYTLQSPQKNLHFKRKSNHKPVK